jgi:hypothetical protein
MSDKNIIQGPLRPKAQLKMGEKQPNRATSMKGSR